MQASYTYQLFEFATTVMSASQQLLSGSNINSVYLQRAGNNQTTPRVELNATIGQSFHYKLTGSNAVSDAYNGQLHALVVTDRGLNEASHSQYIGQVYDSLSNLNGYNNIMPYHRISYMQPTSFSPQIVEQLNFDLSVIALDFKIWIRSDAWPT